MMIILMIHLQCGRLFSNRIRTSDYAVMPYRDRDSEMLICGICTNHKAQS